jgi:hypothetical protein
MNLDKILAVLNLEEACKNQHFKYESEGQINALLEKNLLKIDKNGNLSIPLHVKKIFLASHSGTGICSDYRNPIKA